jgi:hypothetical protein
VDFLPVGDQEPLSFRGGHRRRPGRKVLRFGLVGAVLTAALVAAATFLTAGQAEAAGFAVKYTQTARWESGYTGTYTVTNTSAKTVNSWSLVFTLPAGARISSLWNGKQTTSGQKVTVTNESWNGTLTPKASVVVGFVADASGAQQAAPGGCTINGETCAASDDAPTSAASSTAAPQPTPTRAEATPPTATTPAPASPTVAAPVPSAAATKAPTGGGPVFAPYVDVLLYPPYDMVAHSQATGVKQYTLAFLVSNGSCAASWGGVLPVGDAGLAQRVTALRNSGGDVRISFGGANGSELATVCTSPEQLAVAYQAAIDAYSATRIDFDVEGAALANAAANDRRAKAIEILQQNAAKAGKQLDVSVTLPALPQGLTQDGVNLLNNAQGNQLEFDSVNIMAMDYGDFAAPNPTGQMGRFATDAATATQAQLKSVFGFSDDEAWHKLAVTPMIGVNDVSTEVFTPDDARTVARFVREKGLAWYAMWSATRDQQCAGGAKATADATCSSINQQPDEFTKAFLG